MRDSPASSGGHSPPLSGEASAATVTRLLGQLARGDRAALDELVVLVYDELRLLARHQRRHWRGDFTLDTTALIHEAYLKLVDQQRIGVASRGHFLAVAAKAMRHILCNYARDRRRQKRGGGLQPLSLDALRATPGQVAFSDEQAEALATLDEALRHLEQVDRRQSEVVECRYFAGLTIEDTAAALGTSAATVKRDWALARAWLYRELQPRLER